MNEHDRDNLQFLLTVDADTFKDWYSQTDAEDHEYAQELLAMYSLELKERSIALRIEAELMTMDKFEQAQAVIGKIRG
jgi:hypothetical protein